MIIRTEDQRADQVKFISMLSMDRPWEITVKPYRKRRSLSQNNLLHKWFAEIAQETGDTEAGVKHDLKVKFSPQVESKVLPGIMRPMDTSDMNTAQMNEFMERIYSFIVGDFGIFLTIPEEMDAHGSESKE